MERPDQTCYFKSSDGHVHHWSFSTQRLNLNVAHEACSNSGSIIIDSTRRGKLFPDSFSYTVPIWCAVLNHFVLGIAIKDALILPSWLPEMLKSSVQHSMVKILFQIPVDTIQLVRSSLEGVLLYPLRPIWCCVEDGMVSWPSEDAVSFLVTSESNRSAMALGYTPLILFSCSGDISEDDHREVHSWHYIKGAGDDEENW